MAKVPFAISLDIDLYQIIESKRGKIPRSTFINNTLRAVFSDDLQRS